MLSVTATYGNRHARFLTGLARTWPKWNKERLLVFSDLALSLPAGLVLERWLPREALEEALPGTPFYTKKILILREAVRRYGAREVFWIDADSLVFLRIADVLVRGCLNAVSYGCPGEIRNCKGGLLVPQADFLLNGIFSVPSELIGEWEEIVRAHLAEPGEGCPEMEAWNHLAGRHRDRVELIDRRAPHLVWNLPYEHPTPSNRAWSSGLGLERGILSLDRRRFAVLQWISYALEAHLVSRFSKVTDDGARRVLSSLYF